MYGYVDFNNYNIFDMREVYSSQYIRMRVDNGYNFVWVDDNLPGGTELMVLENASGDLTIAGTLSESSDRRLKKNIIPLPTMIQNIMDLQPSEYEKNNKKSYGLIAQDVQEVFPEVVSQNENGYLSVSYTELIAPLIKAVQEQQKEIEDLKKEIKALKDK
jgi:hypothetical protein